MSTIEGPGARQGDAAGGDAVASRGSALRGTMVAVAVLTVVAWVAMSRALELLLEATRLSNGPRYAAGSLSLPGVVVAVAAASAVWVAGWLAVRRWNVRAAGLGVGLGVGIALLALLALVTVHNVGQIRAGRTPLSVREQAGLLDVEVFTARIDWARDDMTDGVYLVQREPGNPWLQVVAVPPTRLPDSRGQNMGTSMINVRSMTVVNSADA